MKLLSTIKKYIPRLTVVIALFSLTGCGFFSSDGPSRRQVENSPSAANGIQIVDVNEEVTQRLLSTTGRKPFSEVLKPKGNAFAVGPGDVLEYTIWEVPPAMLFTSNQIDSRTGQFSSRVTPFPEQMVSNRGTINVPFVGQVHVAGLDTQQIQTKIMQLLKDKANQPQVLVRLVQNNTSYVTVVGDAGNSARMPLTPERERLLDALAAAGGTKQPVGKIDIQVTRGSNVYEMPLDNIIRDPKQNVVLQRGDVITALYQPYSFTVLGATGKTQEIDYEAKGITLAQALARAGGLQDAVANPRGVYIFRLEPVSALNWPNHPVKTTPDGKVPVIYRIDLKDPGTFFVAQSFPIKNKDILYVSNAPAAEVQKFLNMLISVSSPVFYIVSTVTAFGPS